MNIGILTAILRAVDQTSPVLSTVSKSLQKVGDDFKKVGQIATIALTLPLLAVGAAALKASSEFQTATTKLITLSGLSAAEMGKLRTAVVDLAPAVGIGPTALTEALLIVTSTGIKGAAALDVLERSAKASAIGLGETTDVARAVVSAMNAYGPATMTAARASDTLFAAVQAGGAEANEFAGVLGRVIGVSSQVGVSFEELTTFIATFTRLGVNASEATTALSGVLGTILKPSEAAREQLQALGLSVDGLRQSIKDRGLTQTLLDLVNTIGDNQDALGAIIPNVRALAGVMANAGSQADAYQEVLKAVGGATGELDRQFKTVSETGAFTWSQLKAKAEVLAIAVGDRLAPSFHAAMQAAMPLVGAAAKLVEGFAALPSWVQTSVLGFLALTAAIGPILYAFGTMLSVLGTLAGATGIGAVVTALWTKVTALGATTVAFGTATVAVRAFQAALLGIGIGILLAGIGLLVDRLRTVGREVETMTGKPIKGLVDGFGKAKMTIDDLRASGMLLNDDFKTGLSVTLDTASLNSKKVTAGIADMSNALVKQLAATKIEVAELTEKQKANIAAGLAMGKSTDDITAALNVSAGAKKVSLAAVDMYTEGLKASTSASKEAATAYASVHNAMSGKDAIDQAEQMLAVIQSLGGAHKLSKEALASAQPVLQAAVDAYRAKGRIAPAALQMVSAEIRNNNIALREQVGWWQRINQASGEYIANMRSPLLLTSKNTVAGVDPMTLIAPLKAAGKSAGYQFVDEFGIVIREGLTKPSMWSGLRESLSTILASIPQTLVRAFTGGGGFMGAIKAIGVQMAEAIAKPIFDGISKAITKALAAKATASIAGSVVSSAAGGAAGKAVGSAVAAKAGTTAAMGGMTVATAAWTAGIGLAAIAVWKIWQHNKNLNKEVKEFNVEIDKQRAALLKTHGSFNDLQKKAAAVGMDFSAEWAHQGKAGFAAFEKYIKEFEKKFEALKEDTADTFDGLVDSARNAGIALPTHFRDAIQQMVDLGLLTKDALKQFDELAKPPSWKAMKAAAEELGLDFATLGKSFNGARVADEAELILSKFTLLKRGGVDVGDMLRQTSGRVSQLVADAMATGTALPEQMREYIAELARTGQLFDDNRLKANTWASGLLANAGSIPAGLQEVIRKFKETGDMAMTADELMARFGDNPAMAEIIRQMQAYDQSIGESNGELRDLSGLQWAEPMERSVNRLIGKFEELIDKILNMGHAVSRLPNMPNLPDTGGPGGFFPVPDQRTSAAYGGAMANGGDFLVHRPTMFLAGEAGMERATFTPIGRGSSGSSGSGNTTHVHLHVGDNEVAEAVVDSLGRVLARRGISA